jgi:hypothetical protein
MHCRELHQTLELQMHTTHWGSTYSTRHMHHSFHVLGVELCTHIRNEASICSDANCACGYDTYPLEIRTILYDARTYAPPRAGSNCSCFHPLHSSLASDMHIWMNVTTIGLFVMCCDDISHKPLLMQQLLENLCSALQPQRTEQKPAYCCMQLEQSAPICHTCSVCSRTTKK